MSANTPPELKAVPHAEPRAGDEAPEETTERQAGPAEPGGARRRWLPLLVLAAAVVLVAGYVVERGRANSLAERVTDLEAELQVAHEGLEAAERRMGVVRAHVDDLAARIGALQQVVAEPAGAAPDAEIAEEPLPAAVEDGAVR